MVVSFYPNEVGKGFCKSAYMPSGISGWGLSILVSVACSGVFVLPLDGMLVHCRVIPSINVCWYPFIHLDGERHFGSKVSCPRTQHNVPDQGSNPDHSIWRTLTMRSLWTPPSWIGTIFFFILNKHHLSNLSLLKYCTVWLCFFLITML